MADRERAFIRRRIAEGMDKAQIKRELAAEYGPRVLAMPDEGGFDLAVYLVPGLLVVLGLGGVALAARRWRRTPDAAERPRGRALDPEEARRLDARAGRVRPPVSALAAAASSGVDTTVVAAFAVGFVSFISPCVLPLVPGYLSAVTGVSIVEIQGGERSLTRVMLPAIVFCLSFTAVFVALGMTATGLGSTLRDSRGTLDKVAGAIIIALGVFFLLTPFVPKLNKEWRPDALIARAGSGGPLIAGAAFAVAWTPCVGPTLGAILTTASIQDTVGKGAILLAFYSLGLAVPFLLTAMAFTRAWSAFRWLRDRYLIVTAVSGLVLIGMGVLLLTGELTELNLKAQDGLDSLGLNFFKNL